MRKQLPVMLCGVVGSDPRKSTFKGQLTPADASRDRFCVNNHDYFFFKGNKGRCKESAIRVVN